MRRLDNIMNSPELTIFATPTTKDGQHLCNSQSIDFMVVKKNKQNKKIDIYSFDIIVTSSTDILC